MDKNTFSVRFIIQKGKLNAEGKAPIFARITINREMAHLATRMFALPQKWDTLAGKVVGQTNEAKVINSTLDGWRTLIIQKYNEQFLSGEDITADRLKSIVSGKNDNDACHRLLPLFDDFNADYKLLVDREVTQKTYTRYLLTRNRLAEFMKTKLQVNDIALKDITPKFIHDFDLFLRTHYESSNNHATKFIQRFRTVFNTAKSNGWVTTDPFNQIKLHFDKVDRGFLTADELHRIEEHEMPSDRLDMIRDLFVFSCYTGLAYIDVYNLTTDNIARGDDGKMWIMTHRQKTKMPVNVRLLDKPLAIINKYSRNVLGGKLLKIPSNQKVNDYLKEIAAICGINKAVTFHLARHTFATTITLANGVPIETVSKMLGHTNIRTTEIYARITQTKISNDMEALAQKIDHKTAKRACDITAS